MLGGHPVDVDQLKAKASPSALFTAFLAMFQASEFRGSAAPDHSRRSFRQQSVSSGSNR